MNAVELYVLFVAGIVLSLLVPIAAKWLKEARTSLGARGDALSALWTLALPYVKIAAGSAILGLALLLIFLYMIIIFCGLGIAARTREPFGRLIVVGVVSLLATQVVVNMGMNIGLMPITGLTLPFISYGGSSLLASFIAVGIMMNVAVHPVVVLSRENF